MKRGLRTVIAVVLILVFVTAGAKLVMHIMDQRAAAQLQQEANRLAGLAEPSPAPSEELQVEEILPDLVPKAEPEVEPTPEPAPEPTPEPVPAPTQEPAPVVSSAPANPPVPANPPAPVEDPAIAALADVDLAALRQVNADVVGWIAIPGTQLSYPLMQGPDNNFYLNHTWKKAKSSVGSIYLDYRNNDDMLDFNSIIYGHRMNDGSMFNCLRHYKDLSYWQAHPSIYIVTDSGIHRYDIFAAYEADAVGGSTYRLGLKEAEGQQAYINYCSRRSVIQTGVTPEPGDCIITLSTCVSMGAEYDTRWVVQAVRKMSD